ncbi:hypothetical protein Tco_0341222 [Tanacetum coccineum]
MGSNEEIIQLLQKTQMIFKQTQRDKEEKYLNDIIQLQDKIKDLENVVCKMGRSTDTLRLLTNEQKAFRVNNLLKSCFWNNLHVFDSEETLEDAEKSQLKMNEFQKDEKVQELKIQPIDYEKLNKLYFVPQKELSEISNSKRASIFYTSPTEIEQSISRRYKRMKDAFEQNDVYLDEIENQNDLLKDQLFEASLTANIKNLVITSCMEIVKLKEFQKESTMFHFESLRDCKTIVGMEKDLFKHSEAKCIAFEIAFSTQ